MASVHQNCVHATLALTKCPFNGVIKTRQSEVIEMPLATCKIIKNYHIFVNLFFKRELVFFFKIVLVKCQTDSL